MNNKKRCILENERELQAALRLGSWCEYTSTDDTNQIISCIHL